MRIIPVCILVSLSWQTLATGADGDIVPVIATGQDWSFPSYVEKSPRGGYFQMSGTSQTTTIAKDLDELLNCYGITLTWAELNPYDPADSEENQTTPYNFAPLENALAVAQEDDKCLVVRLKGSVVDRMTEWDAVDVPFIPQWVLGKHAPPEFYTSGDADSEEFIRVAAPWNTGVTTEYLKFVEEFGKRNLLAHEKFTALYVHGISSSAGEEMWLNSLGALNAEAAGMTQANLQEAYQQRLTAWAAAAGSMRHKLAWVGMNSFALPEKDYYKETRLYLNNLAAELGLGIRSGGNEAFTSAFSPYWGLSYDEQVEPEDPEKMKVRLTLDTDWAYRDYNRYIGGEDEQYLDMPEYDLYFASTIWVEALIGTSHIWLPGDSLNDFIQRNREILDWFSYRRGIPLAEAPDAAIWLRESYFSDGVTCYAVQNFELGLSQVITAGTISVPADYHDRSEAIGGIFPHDCAGLHEDYLCARTDVEEGSNTIAIAIDDDYHASLDNLVAIKVIYLDNSQAQWYLATPTLTSTLVQNSADGAEKTATFLLNTTHLKTTFSDGSHFRLVVANNGDLTVRIIRLVKMVPETGDIDANGTIDLRDTITTLRVLTGLNVADGISSDGAVQQEAISLGDAIYTLKHQAH